MLGHLLCRVGLHRWEFKDSLETNGDKVCITKARCVRHDCVSSKWLIVNREVLGRPW